MAGVSPMRRCLGQLQCRALVRHGLSATTVHPAYFCCKRAISCNVYASNLALETTSSLFDRRSCLSPAQSQTRCASTAGDEPFSFTPPGRNHLFVPGKRFQVAMLGREGLGNLFELANPLSLVAISASSARCIAGPVNIHDDVLRAMNVQSQNHRDAWFAPFFKYI